MNSTWNDSNDSSVDDTSPTSSKIAEYGYLIVSVLFLVLALVTCCYTPMEKLIRFCTCHGPSNQETLARESQNSNQEAVTHEGSMHPASPTTSKKDDVVIVQSRADCCSSPQGQVCAYSFNAVSTSRRKALNTNSTGLDLESGTSVLDLICPICLESFHVNDNVAWSMRLSTCPHVFHCVCIKLWLESSHYDCPCCRRDFQYPCNDPTTSSSNQDTENIVENKSNRKQGRFCIKHGLIISNDAQTMTK